MIKDENYYVIHGWMRNRLGLKGNELTIYAILYGFTQDGESEFSGSVAYLTEFIGVSKDTVSRILDKLEGYGYIEKNDKNFSTGKPNGYKCVPIEKVRGVGKMPTPVSQNAHPGIANCIGGVGKMPTDNESNIYINKEFNIEVSKKENNNLNINKNLQSYDELLDDFGVFGEYREAMFRFIGHLKVNHDVVMFNNRLQDLVVKLDMCYSKDYEKASALDDAIAHNYKFLECEIA